MTTEIETGTPCLTLVNVYPTTPATQQRIIHVADEATKGIVSKLPGFISAKFLASRDGLRIVNYSQWESVAALEGFLTNPACRPMIDEVLSLCDGKPDIHHYDVIATYRASTAVSS